MVVSVLLIVVCLAVGHQSGVVWGSTGSSTCATKSDRRLTSGTTGVRSPRDFGPCLVMVRPFRE